MGCQELCFSWEQDLGVTWAGAQQLSAPDPEAALPTDSSLPLTRIPQVIPV